MVVFDADTDVLEANIPKFESDVMVGPVMFPDELIVPETSSLKPGLVVATPTFPFESICSREVVPVWSYIWNAPAPPALPDKVLITR